MPDAVLTLNAGSSSIKFALFEDFPDGLAAAFRGQVEGIGGSPRLTIRRANGAVETEQSWPGGGQLGHEAFFEEILSRAGGHLGDDRLVAFSHRVAHGGPDFADPVEVTAAVLEALDKLCPLAPLHQPHNLAAVRTAMRLRPDVRQVACFDTAFHRTLPRSAQRLPLPQSWVDKGLRRYGFHGLSYDYVAGRLKALDPTAASGRVVVAHLGSGASLCAIRQGRSVDTTMGFSTLDGLMMGARCGSLDPGVVLYLIQEAGLDGAAIEDLLYRHAGLAGVSGITGDMRLLLESAEPAAAEAVDLWLFRLVRELGAMVASLQGLDTLVFTAGIGEHAPAIRARVCERLDWLGVRLDAEANGRSDAVISAVDSAVTVRVIPTDEEAVLASSALALIGQA